MIGVGIDVSKSKSTVAAIGGNGNSYNLAEQAIRFDISHRVYGHCLMKSFR